MSFVVPVRCSEEVVHAHVDDDGELTYLDYDLDEDIVLEEMGYPVSDCLQFVRDYEKEPVLALLGSENILIPNNMRVLIATGIADNAVDSFGRWHNRDTLVDTYANRMDLKDIVLMSGNVDKASQAKRLVGRARKQVKKAKKRRDVAESEITFRIAFMDLYITRSVLESMKALHAYLYGFATLSGSPDKTIPEYAAAAASQALGAAYQKGIAERKSIYEEEKQKMLDYILGFLSDHLEDEE